MAWKHYDKLVRDKIPAIIKKDGKQCIIDKIPKRNYCYVLHCKLEEESEELEQAKETNNIEAIIEELADVCEVFNILKKLGYATPRANELYTKAFIYIDTNKISTKDILLMQKKKRKEKGAFKKRIYLRSAEEVTQRNI